MPTRRTEVGVTLGGAEIAKWIRRKMGDPPRMGYAPQGDNYVVVSGSYPVVIDMEDTMRIPYMDPDETYVEFRIRPSVLDAGEPSLGAGQLGITAICALMEAGIPVDESTRMEVRVIKYA